MSEDNLVWSKEFLLSWSDFKADPNPAAYEDAHSVIKFRPTWMVHSEKMGSNISFFIEGLDISVEFQPQLSWVRESYANNDLLKHEQGHFDLAEIIKRENLPKLQNLFYEKKYPTRGQNEDQRKQFAKEDSTKMIFLEIEKLDSLLEKKRHDYDQETNFGENLEKQNSYNTSFEKLRI